MAVTRGYLRDLREAAAAQDTALLVLLIPHLNDVSPVLPQFSLNEVERLLRHPLPKGGERYQNGMQLMKELGIPHLNPIHLLDFELDYVPRGFHWTNAGHQKIGAVLSACIETFQVSGDLADCEGVEMP